MDPVHKPRSTRLVEYAFAPIPFRNGAPFCETFRDFWHKCGTMYRIFPLSRIFITPCRIRPYDFQKAAVPEIPGTFTPFNCHIVLSAAACPHSEGLPARRRRVNLRLAGEPQAGHGEKNFVFRLLHIRRIAPKPAPSAGINCTWYNYFPFFILSPSALILPPYSVHSIHHKLCVVK